MEILGMYENWIVVNLASDGGHHTYAVMTKDTKKVLWAGTKKRCEEVFALLISGIMQEKDL